jgi:NitT/TauT family transport system ATP-binding protein
MDEPFSRLDAQTRALMHDEVLRIHRLKKMTIVFVTHDVEESVVLADRVVVMSPRPGRIERIIDVALPRPRGLDARRAPEFVRIAEEITDIFLARGVLHGAHTR